MLVLLASACGSSAPPRATQPDTTAAPSAVETSPWCVPVSREQAIFRVTRLRGEVAADDRVAAKLVNGTEFHSLQPNVITGDSEFAPSSFYWAVLVTGSVRPAFATGSYAWGVFRVNARTADIGGVVAGPESKPPSFDDLPDHAHDCERSRGTRV